MTAPAPFTVRYGAVCLVGAPSQTERFAAPAKAIYPGRDFRARRAFAEQLCDAWYILSPRHGLVEPDTVIEPGEEFLVGFAREAQLAWAQRVFESMKARIAPDIPIVLLTGGVYDVRLSPYIRRWAYQRPFDGLDAEERYQLLVDAVAAAAGAASGGLAP